MNNTIVLKRLFQWKIYCSSIHWSDYILEETDMPDELIRGVQGDIVLAQTLPQVIFPLQRHFHRPQMKFGEGNVLTGICLLPGGVGGLGGGR